MTKKWSPFCSALEKSCLRLEGLACVLELSPPNVPTFFKGPTMIWSIKVTFLTGHRFLATTPLISNSDDFHRAQVKLMKQ